MKEKQFVLAAILVTIVCLALYFSLGLYFKTRLSRVEWDPKYDVDGDGIIDDNDVMVVKEHKGEYGSTHWGPKYDVNYDGHIDKFDVLILKTRYGVTPEPWNWTGDIERDGDVDLFDAVIGLKWYGMQVPPWSNGSIWFEVIKDGKMNFLDMLVLLSRFGSSSDQRYDVNNDGHIDLFDILLVSARNGEYGSIDWNLKYDVNDDGIIDVSDVKAVEEHLGTTKP